MAFEYEAGGDLSNGGQWLSDPGTYHMLITDISEEPTSKDGTLVPNAAFRVTCAVCDGTVPGQAEKTTDITFFRPKATDKNEGAFARKKIDRFLVATCLMTEEQVLEKAKVRIDLQEAVGRQFVVKLEKEKEDSKFLSLSFADIFHVDDSAVANIPRSKEHLSLIDKKLRKVAKPASGKGLTPEKKADKAKASPAPTPAPTTTEAAPAEFDYGAV